MNAGVACGEKVAGLLYESDFSPGGHANAKSAPKAGDMPQQPGAAKRRASSTTAGEVQASTMAGVAEADLDAALVGISGVQFNGFVLQDLPIADKLVSSQQDVLSMAVMFPDLHVTHVAQALIGRLTDRYAEMKPLRGDSSSAYQ